MCIGGGIGGGDAARRLPSFSAAPTLSSPRSVINLASEILNLAPPAYRFFLSQVTLSNLPLYGKSLYLQLCTRDMTGYYFIKIRTRDSATLITAAYLNLGTAVLVPYSCMSTAVHVEYAVHGVDV